MPSPVVEVPALCHSVPPPEQKGVLSQLTPGRKRVPFLSPVLLSLLICALFLGGAPLRKGWVDTVLHLSVIKFTSHFEGKKKKTIPGCTEAVGNAAMAIFVLFVLFFFFFLPFANSLILLMSSYCWEKLR